MIAVWSTVNGRSLRSNVSDVNDDQETTIPSNVSDANDNIDQFNKFIATEIGTITEALQNVIPASYGDCGRHSPPQPCQDKGSDLFYTHKSWAYKATARWIAGLKTIAFDSIKVGADADGNLNSVVGAGHFENLPVSIHIEECFTFDKCSNMWDNSDACCGSDKHFAVTIDVKCDSSTKRLEYLNLGKLDLDDFKITESLGKLSLPSYDITNSVHGAASGVLGDYLSEAFIPYNGTKVTIVDYLNANRGDFLNSLC